MKLKGSVSRERWLVAQRQEERAVSDADSIKEFLRVRRHTWARLVDELKISVDPATRILEIGGGPTSIFLAIREGERYAVDPAYSRLFDMHPFMRDVEEYKGVNFIGCPLEEMAPGKQFDIIFMVNVLDHVGSLKPVVDKIEELLAPGGTLVIVVDCYADPVVKNIIRFFDPDPSHPHHFTGGEVSRLFSGYRLTRQDNRLSVFSEVTFRGQRVGIPVYRLDKFLSRMVRYHSFRAKKWDIPFVTRYILCHSLALLVATLRRRERPIYPFKKPRLFVFQKPTEGWIVSGQALLPAGH